MIKRKLFGQHFLCSDAIAKSIVSEAHITKTDIVFEIGTGKGILTLLLCQNAYKVISVDLDENLVRSAKSRLGCIENLALKSGDGLARDDTFDIFVSNLPYSRSKDAFEWLACTPFSHGVVMVQQEFAEKLLAKSGKQRRAISIVATHALEIETLFKVGKNNFSPPPKVDSIVLKIRKKNDMTKDVIQTVNKIFSYRRKTAKNILKQFGRKSTIDKRVDDLTGDQIIDLARQILEK